VSSLVSEFWGPTVQPESGFWAKPSIHQPSKTEKWGRPFRMAFIPEVPEASSGRMGVLSQRSEPETKRRDTLGE